MDGNSHDNGMPTLKRAYPSGSNNEDGENDSESEDPKRLCIDEEGCNLQCPKCPYLAKWKSDLERHMKVRFTFNRQPNNHISWFVYKSYWSSCLGSFRGEEIRLSDLLQVL